MDKLDKLWKEYYKLMSTNTLTETKTDIKNKKEVKIPRPTPLGTMVMQSFPSNSNRARKEARKGKVIWAGGTKIGSF